METVAVVGGSGFVGQRLATALLASGRNVRVVDVVAPVAADVTYRQADVRDRRALSNALEGSEVVYNLAAVHRDDVRPVSLYNDVNVTGAANVCHACRDVGVRQVIFTSSVAVYGVAAPDTSEDLVPAPVNAYGCSKLRAEALHREWQVEESEQRSLVIVRPTVVFGENNRGNFYHLVRQIKEHRFVMIGSGCNQKSMAYVENVSAFLVHALLCGAGFHLFNYVDGPDLSTDELVRTIRFALGRRPVVGVKIPYCVGYLGGVMCDLVASVTNRRLPISALRVKKFCTTTTFTASRVEHTGFRRPFGISDALVKTIEHEFG